MDSKSNVLIVDDNETNLYTIRKVLERLDVVIHTALSGPDAIVMAENTKYTLALVDIQMPEMDGFETLKLLRETNLNQNLPVVLISAIYTEDQYRLRGMETGAVDFIPKPVSPEILRAKVKVFIELERNQLMLREKIKELGQINEELKSEIQKREVLEEKLRAARTLAEERSEMKSQLLVNMSHEIRTPVNSILGFADLLVNPGITDTEKEKYLKYVSNSSQNLLFLIDEILDHSRLESGQMKIKTMVFNLDELMSELHEAFQRIKTQVEKDNLKLLLDLPLTPAGFIEGDQQRIRQVLSNLIHNAIKYSNKGEIRFGYRIKKQQLEFYVKDQGIGIAPHDIPQLFTRFSRIEDSNNVKIAGTGLGLSISKRMVELMNGKIWVSSKPGEGSDFRFSIPYTSKEKSRTKHADRGSVEVDNEQWSHVTVLVAEDEEMNYLFLNEALKNTGIQLIWAKNGLEAVKQVENNPKINLVLMDIKMPDMDGYTATQNIKRIKPDLPVIIQTAFALSDEKEKCQENGCDDYITKPINRKLLLKTLKRFLDQ